MRLLVSNQLWYVLAIPSMNKILIFCYLGLIVILPRPATLAQNGESDFPAWIRNVGARSEPRKPKLFSANSCGAKAEGMTSSTHAIQAAISECSASGGGVVTLEKGEYVTGAI